MHLISMHINRLINDYHLDVKVIDSLENNNKKINTGIFFTIDRGILLDFIKAKFYFHKSGEFMAKEILKYKYFINDKDLLEKILDVIFEDKRKNSSRLFRQIRHGFSR